MNKIGILTFHNSNNYGAVLQNYALFYTCVNLGNDVTVINYINSEVKNDSIIDDVKRESGVYSKTVVLFKKLIFLNINLKKNYNFTKFRKQFLNISKNKIYSPNEFYDNDLDLDYYIVGSDQVWNKNIVKKHIDAYLLNMKKPAIKISYAASIGELSSDTSIFNRLKNFKAISVREESSKKYLQDSMNLNNISRNIDPTLLLSKEEWINISVDINVNEDYILLYVVEENSKIKEIVDELSRLTGLKVIYFSKLSNVSNKYKSFYNAGPREFISLFEKASYVVTNSFHGTIFSIIFEKKFFVINHRSRGNRISELLELLKIESRIIKDKKEIVLEDEINYKKVKETIINERKQGISYLKEVIKKR